MGGILKAICFNGQEAKKLFFRHFPDPRWATHLEGQDLPTSGANAIPYVKKLQEWHDALSQHLALPPLDQD